MQEKEPVRVLVTAPLGVGGVTNMMINIQSHWIEVKSILIILFFTTGKKRWRTRLHLWEAEN